MQSATILMSGVRPAIQARLRSEFQDAEIVPLGDGRGHPAPARNGATSAAVVSLDGDPERGFRVVRELSSAGVRVVVLGLTKDPDLILHAMRAGAREFVLAGDDAELARALRDQVKPNRSADASRIYAVFPAKGGVGGTTLATNLAGAFQRGGNRTCLIDLNLNMGDVLAFLDLQGGYSILDVIANMRRLDRQLLDSTLVQHASGVRVIAQSHRIEESDRIEPALLSSMLRFLRQHYRAIVLDGLRSFDEVSVAALDAADEIMLVVTQEVPAVRDARRCVDLLRRLGADDKLKLIVNRFQKGLQITPAVVSETVGLPIAATVPNDYPAVIRAVNRGQLLFEEAPRSATTKGVEQLAALLGRAPADEAETRPSLLKRLFARGMGHAAQ
ncbi:AAA family ATPase [Anaeromyxobacter oryzae]|uniref:Transcriptional regulator n=1 Tax=Anaeromyxobacter oryzae TaxID=2918170 RepID=A0ABM7WP13_9BACT|nr:AAA family ATPase [Anaeromyxobacter oryzae]BDG01207.1 transcriptional regulator [Anaeromyxobacter oryzae]